MSPTTLLILDWFLNILHFAIVFMLCFGWIAKATRKFHRILLCVVTICWLAIGPLMGKSIGYCPVTDWAWQVRTLRGETELEYGYINYLTEKLGVYMSNGTTDLVVGVIFGFIWLMTIILWVREYKIKRSSV